MNKVANKTGGDGKRESISSIIYLKAKLRYDNDLDERCVLAKKLLADSIAGENSSPITETAIKDGRLAHRLIRIVRELWLWNTLNHAQKQAISRLSCMIFVRNAKYGTPSKPNNWTVKHKMPARHEMNEIAFFSQIIYPNLNLTIAVGR